MRTPLLVLFLSMSCIAFSQSFLLSDDQSSGTLPLTFASQSGENQLMGGYVYSKNGKYDLGMEVGYFTNSSIFLFTPVYRKYIYNDPDPDGLAAAVALRYIMLLDQNGNTAHNAAFTPSIYYRIPTEKVVFVPQFDVQYSRSLEFNLSAIVYAVKMNLAFRTEKGFITLKPQYQFGDDVNLFSLGLNFQWIKGKS